MHVYLPGQKIRQHVSDAKSINELDESARKMIEEIMKSSRYTATPFTDHKQGRPLRKIVDLRVTRIPEYD